MEPRIQYANTSDGVNIAFWTLGEGPPLVFMPFLMASHTQMEWQVPGARALYERLARRRMLVRYDCRATGLSEREVTDHSLEAVLLDLAAVVDRLEMESFALFAPSRSGPVAITYAARHPERVSHLILWHSPTKDADYLPLRPRIRTVQSLLERDWELFTDTFAHVLYGWSAGRTARQAAAFWRESITPEAARAFLTAFRDVDVTDILPQVSPPTLVLHRRKYYALGLDVARRLVSRLPNARLGVLEGRAALPYLEDAEGMVGAVYDFLGEEEEAAATPVKARAAAGRAVAGLVTILFTDVEGSTALTQRLGDAKAREVLREHERIVREALRAHGGSEVKTMGDGFMASFGSATRALECAVAMQRAFEEWNASLPARPEALERRAEQQPPARGPRTSPRAGGDAGLPPAEPIRVRIGLNAGEPIAEGEDLFGTAVILAARIAGQAQGGEILVSDVVRQLVAGKGFLFADRGETALRGFEDPVRLFEVRWRE